MDYTALSIKCSLRMGCYTSSNEKRSDFSTEGVEESSHGTLPSLKQPDVMKSYGFSHKDLNSKLSMAM